MPTPDATVILDDYSLLAEGDIDLISTASDKLVTVQAAGSNGAVHVQGAKMVVMTVGTASVTVDADKNQATLQGLESVKIGVGPPAELGAVIELSPTGITLSLAQIITVKLGPTGIELKAAETSLKVGVEGITSSGPLLQESAEAARKVSTTLEQQQTSATRQFSAGVDMVG
jgi:hypothetical protein